MFNLSIFAERLDGLIFEHKMNGTELAESIGITKSAIYRYLRKERIPSVEILIRLADYFHCSISFLIGLENENYTASYYPCEPFANRFRFLLEHFNKSKYQLIKETRLPETAVYSWQRGDSIPTIDSIIKLSEFFSCTVDYVLGRER